MTRRPLSFRQADVERAVKAALSTGLAVGMVEVTQNGTIRILTAAAIAEQSAANPFDNWKAKKNAGSS
jgi:hypothetical protein